MRGIVVFILIGLFSSFSEGAPFHLESESESPRLVELYTSQGCSSCPPAEEWLGRFVEDPELWTKIVPVAYHVDYWDRLGWKDRFATHENTLRQYRLRDEGTLQSVYTPGFVVDGKEWRGWFQRSSLSDIGRKKNTGKLVVEIDAERLKADYSGQFDGATLVVAILGIGLKTDVLRGENRGRLLEHNFVALEWVEKPFDHGTAEFALQKTTKGSATRYGIAVWVVKRGSSIPVAVVGGWLPEEELLFN